MKKELWVLVGVGTFGIILKDGLKWCFLDLRPPKLDLGVYILRRRSEETEFANLTKFLKIRFLSYLIMTITCSRINLTVSWKTAYPWSVEANSSYHIRHKEANRSYEKYMQIEFVHSCSVSIYVTHFHGWGQDHLEGAEKEEKKSKN